MIETHFRRIRSSFSVFLAVSIVLLSPGAACYQAVAAEIEGPAGKGVMSLPVVNAGLAAPLNIPGAQVPGASIPNLEVPGMNAAVPALPAAALDAARLLPSAAPVAPSEAAPGTPQATAAQMSKLAENLAPQIEAAARADNADPRGSGETIERLIEGERVPTAAAPIAPEAIGTAGASSILPHAELANPYGFYQHAYPAAVAKAQELGKSPAQVHFYEATASAPGIDGASWKFAFYLTDKETSAAELSKAKPQVGDIIYVDFQKSGFGSRGVMTVSDDPHVDSYLQQYVADQARYSAPRSYAQTYDAPRVSVYKDAPLSADWVPFTPEILYFKKGSQASAQAALEAARRHGMSGGVSVSFKMREQPVSGDRDYWYSFHDNAGNVFLANGRSGEERFVKNVPAAPAETSAQRLSRYTKNGRSIGEAAGIALTGLTAAALLHANPESLEGLKAMLIAVLMLPAQAFVLSLGLEALGGKIGRRFGLPKAERSGGPNVAFRGVVGGLATLGAAWALGALTGASPLLYLAMLSIPQVVAGIAGLVTALVVHRKLDFKSDKWARFGGTSLMSGALSGASLFAAIGYFLFAFAGTVKDVSGAKAFPMHDGPAPLYKKAAAAAIKAAEGKGYKLENMYLAGMEARYPLDAKKGWTAQFIAKKSAEDAEGEVINAYLYPGKEEGDWTASAYAYGKAEISSDTKLLKLMNDLGRATPKNLGDALIRAAKALKVKPEDLGFELQPWREGDAWGTDLAYVFDTVDGRRWGINARTGKKVSVADTGVSVARIEAAAKSVASYKGRPWSQTEYNMSESMTGDSLRRDGASPAQMRLFQKLCDEAPVRGGGFNPWSGD